VPETSVQGVVGDAEIAFHTGKLALQADGSVVIAMGGTEVLATATATRQPREGVDFFPLTVDVEERMYAAGKIPGSFFRREGRPTEKATLSARLIDRPLRPLFRDGYRCETHVVATVLSVDDEHPYDVLALNAASAALMVSPIPFLGPVGAVLMAFSGGAWIPMATYPQLENAVFSMVVAGKRNEQGGIDIAMVEAGATEEGLRLVAAGQPAVDEAAVARGLDEAKEHIARLIDLQLELRASLGEIPVVEFPVTLEYGEELLARVIEAATPRLADVVRIPAKKERNAAEDAARAATLAELGITEDHEDFAAATRAFKTATKQAMRRRVIEEGIRLDGRNATEVRPISVEVGLVARAHGSGLFQRGETQVLNVTTLGMLRMEQMLDTISFEETKRYMHHYNFPPFSTGEVGFMRGPRRREIGHGALAEKALLPVIPTEDQFPYAFRLVSEVLSSNGSTSMASVCGSSLSLMDAGVPVTAAVAGVAMGLIAHEGGYVTLTDILGAEDALGDMDFKVAGTRDMITALQLDTKVEGLPAEVLAQALDQARAGRMHILDEMDKVISSPRPELNRYAPRIEAVQIPRDKIGEVIGPKGKIIRQIEEETGATLEMEDDGTVRIGSPDGESLQKAKDWVLAIAFPPEPELGKEYEGEIVNITSFGAFVNILPGRDGLLHISKMGGGKRVERVEDVFTLGDRVTVVVRDIDRNGKVSLDLPGAAAASGEEGGEREGRRPEGGYGDRDRGRGGDRDRDRGRGGDRGRDPGRRPRGEQPRAGQSAGDRRQGSHPGRTVVSFEDDFERGL
jgi:polyribonucleotide nucleotidyltransferase